jgi:hypothetical protein
MAHSNLGTLKAIIESALGIKPRDMSEAAKKERDRFADLSNFDGIRFMVKLGVEPAKGDYKAKNIMELVITPDMKQWRAIEQVEQLLAPTQPIDARANSKAEPKAIIKPVWAQ